GSLKLLGLQGLDAARDVSTIVGVLASAGIEGSTAGTNMAQALSRMAEVGHRLDRGQVAKLVGPMLDQHQIKLDFFTESGEFKGLRPMVVELEKLKALNPQDLTTTLKKLFGDYAAQNLAILLKAGVAGYDQMLERIRQQADMEMKIQEIMSGTKMQWETLTGTVSNLMTHIGAVVSKVSFLPGILARLNDLAGGLDDWVVAHPKTAGIIGGVVIALTTLALVSGGLLLTIGIGGTLVTKMVVGFGFLIKAVEMIKVAALAATPAIWSMTVALLSNPMTWIVVGVVAAVAAMGAAIAWMYRRVEWFRNLMNSFLFLLGFSLGTIVKAWITLAQWIFQPFQAIWSIIDRVIGILPRIAGSVSDALAGVLNAFPAILSRLYQSGRKIISTVVDGIISMASGPVDAVKAIFQRVREMLPFSDAREGPLSQLTLSGKRIMQTLEAGISSAAPGLRNAMAAGLAGAALTTSVAISPPPVIADIERPAISTQAGVGATVQAASGGRSIVVHINKIELPGVTNAQDFIVQLQEMVEGYDAE
ncbi:MAG: phage tail tape measure protein, partial [Syntrophales bacterium]